MNRIHAASFPFVVALGAIGCGGHTTDDLGSQGTAAGGTETQNPGAGGSSSSTGGSGGTTSVGGTSSKGGTTSAGGSVAAGGTSAQGGTVSMGGISAIGGSQAVGGSEAVGGSVATGGTSAVGGTSSAGSGGFGGSSFVCCNEDDPNACPGETCHLGLCYPTPPSGQCWSNQDCPGATCVGSTQCSCAEPGCTPSLGICQTTVMTCCTGDGACAGGECVDNVCKPFLPAGECWRDSDCGDGSSCEGVSVCPCGDECPIADQPGTCIAQTQTCCMSDVDCPTGDECVNTVCVPIPSPGACWRDADCGMGAGNCVGGEVCGCFANCPPIQNLGMCELPMFGCPQTPPQGGSSCASEGVSCEYGSDERIGCRDKAACQNGIWEFSEPDCAAIAGPGQNGCPTSTQGSGSSCGQGGEVCDEGGGALCGCGICEGACTPELTWTCSSPPPAPCPAIAPDLGQACALPPGVTCNYGFCGTSTGTNRGCENGVWVDLGELCPG